ncbi:hypothetical protein DEM26_18755 [Thioclava sp. NG1]|uniref:biotin/lipoyl-containing protein n=1 Tax=Thioclava sp. NG1 TaxID=2182426 RepID=UPI000D61B981|nr:biotin/lipoyl-containing protein [Thioclava sp. NG1]PWE48381.1 hypothetical protein DEM26_18755 [Thioclava sp. NG1]
MYSETEMTRLVEAMRRTGSKLLEVDGAGDHLRLVLGDAEPAASEIAPLNAAPKEQVKSPGLGRFIAVGRDDGLEPVSAGAAVSEGQVLGYIDDDGVRLPFCAPAAGTLTAALVAEGQVTGYGDVLFELEVVQ